MKYNYDIIFYRFPTLDTYTRKNLYMLFVWMKTRILCISDSDKHFSSAISEYIKRLGKDNEIIDIKPEKNGTRTQIIQKETTRILDYLSKHINQETQILILAKEWIQLSTEQFLSKIEKNHTTIFIIGWPYWLDLWAFWAIPHDIIAFGNITLPHGLAKLVLLEQIYRAKMILEGREYHY